MSKIRILAIEDDPILAQALEITVTEMGHQLLKVVDNGTDALAMHQSAQPDLVLMDIKLKGYLNGIEVAEKMNDFSPTPIIFITSLRDHPTFDKAKELIPLAYLIKPFDEINLMYAIELAISRINSRNHFRWENDVLHNDSFFIKDQSHLVKISFDEIVLVIVEGKYVKIITGEKEMQARVALKDLERQLPAGAFIRIHRNYLVNRSMIEDIDLEKNIVYVRKNPVPLGTTFRDHVLKQLNILR